MIENTHIHTLTYLSMNRRLTYEGIKDMGKKSRGNMKFVFSLSATNFAADTVDHPKSSERFEPPAGETCSSRAASRRLGGWNDLFFIPIVILWIMMSQSSGGPLAGEAMPPLKPYEGAALDSDEQKNYNELCTNYNKIRVRANFIRQLVGVICLIYVIIWIIMKVVAMAKYIKGLNKEEDKRTESDLHDEESDTNICKTMQDACATLIETDPVTFRSLQTEFSSVLDFLNALREIIIQTKEKVQVEDRKNLTATSSFLDSQIESVKSFLEKTPDRLKTHACRCILEAVDAVTTDWDADAVKSSMQRYTELRPKEDKDGNGQSHKKENNNSDSDKGENSPGTFAS
eukprot:GHVH01001466.1.p1 GENE.GHVH01001466.1~~GHVH01001466.1.p1  ORF type:complete len:344 (+),score=52.31 GHVH01001466.1:23-1054(+)